MGFLDGLAFFYIVLAGVGFTFILGYFAFCGLRQYVDDARTGAAYRSDDEQFRRTMRDVK